MVGCCLKTLVTIIVLTEAGTVLYSTVVSNHLISGKIIYTVPLNYNEHNLVALVGKIT